VTSECMFSGQTEGHATDAVVMVTSRVGDDSLWLELESRENEWADKGVKSIKLIGDAQSPAPIAWATYAGHRFARELDMPDIGDDLPFRREIAELKSS
jgi:dimethylamine/trimethylamine dehydrogenase